MFLSALPGFWNFCGGLTQRVTYDWWVIQGTTLYPSLFGDHHFPFSEQQLHSHERHNN